MRKEEFRRGTAAYNLAKAQGRLPSQKKAKQKAVQGPKTKAMSTPTPKQAGEKLMATFRKLTKVDNKAPVSRKIIEEEPSAENKRFLGIFPTGTFTSRRGPNRR
jgi:hypothetical protein